VVAVEDAVNACELNRNGFLGADQRGGLRRGIVEITRVDKSSALGVAP
jgi:hypothetical protein